MINVFSNNKNNFWVFNPIDIINLKNIFRIEGNTIYDLNFFQKPMLILELNIEEVCIGIEFGFLKIKMHNFSFTPNIMATLRKFFSSEFSNKKLYLKNESGSKNFHVKKWRETMLIICRSMKKNFKDKRREIKLFRIQKLIKKKKNYIDLNYFFFTQTLSKFDEIIVFRDLWQKGLIINNGIKFGSTFTVYSGYIGFFHSFASIYVINPFSNFYLVDLISFGRIGTSTKKRTIITYLSRNLFIKYFGIKWLNDLP